MDCNEEIKRLIAERMEKGRVAYGHGLIQNDEARKHGLKVYDWVQESIEEALDLAIYLTAKLIEVKKKTGA
jgi:hypothetical protein